MEEIFVVQKRPTVPKPPSDGDHSDSGFYYRIINGLTGVAVSGKMLSADEAKAECKRLNGAGTVDHSKGM